MFVNKKLNKRKQNTEKKIILLKKLSKTSKLKLFTWHTSHLFGRIKNANIVFLFFISI